MDEQKSKIFLLDAIQISLLTCFCLTIGLKPLNDLDIGWHLAGGLWTIEHGSVPRIDFLGSESAPWIAYSWIVEVLTAGCFRLFGFFGLMVMQLLLSWCSAVGLYSLLCSLARSQSAERHVPARLICGGACFVLVQLLTPFWDLRPQLVSVIFFILLLSWAERGRLEPIRTALLTVLWANIHVFWIAAPALVFCYRFLEDGERFIPRTMRAVLHLLLLLACGAASPYGIGNLSALWQYAAEHHEGYQLIREFQPLRPDLGYVFGVFIIVAALPFFSLRRLMSVRPALLLVWTGTLVAALVQRKYLTVFAPASCAVYAYTVVPALAERVKLRAESTSSPAARIGLVVSAVLFASLVFAWTELPAPIPVRTQALIAGGSEISRLTQTANFQQNVLGSFDDGGWLGLSLYLNRPPGAAASLVRTAIDGRTLVMGAKRLADYAKVEGGAPESCEVVEKWRVQFMVLQPTFPLVQDLLEHRADGKFRNPCLKEWQVLSESGDYVLAKRR